MAAKIDWQAHVTAFEALEVATAMKAKAAAQEALKRLKTIRNRATGLTSDTLEYAQVIANALNAAYSPGMTDLMLSPEDIDAALNDPPKAANSKGTP